MRCRCGGRPGYVYRLYARGDLLLYVGATSHVRSRFQAHKKTKSWWSDVTRIETLQCDCRCDAFRREAAELREERALYSQPVRTWQGASS